MKFGNLTSQRCIHISYIHFKLSDPSVILNILCQISLTSPLQSAVPEVIELMDNYYLSKEDWDTIVELGVDEKKDDLVLKKITAATKTALTRKWVCDVITCTIYGFTDFSLRK